MLLFPIYYKPLLVVGEDVFRYGTWQHKMDLVNFLVPFVASDNLAQVMG